MCIWPRNCGKTEFLPPSGIGFNSFFSASPSTGLLLKGARISL